MYLFVHVSRTCNANLMSLTIQDGQWQYSYKVCACLFSVNDICDMCASVCVPICVCICGRGFSSSAIFSASVVGRYHHHCSTVILKMCCSCG